MLATLPSGAEPVVGGAAAAPPPRPGSPVEPRRLLAALRHARRVLLGVTLVAAVVGAVLGKLLPKTYLATATLLWEPPAAAHADPVRELATLAQSVKLPAHLLQVRERTGTERSVEALAKAVDVTQGENSMLLTVVAHANKADEAARLAQTIVDVFVDAQRECARGRLRDMVVALRESLSQAETAHTKAREQYDAFSAKLHVEDFPTEIQGTIQEVARLRVGVKDAQVELQSVVARQGALRQSHAESPESVVLSRNEQNSDEARLGQLETELAEVSGRYAPDHPRVQVLDAEIANLRRHAGAAAPIVSGQTIGRSALRDTLSAQIEESGATRSAITERAHALEELQQRAESRAAQLTSVQGEAARLLADVRANEEHVGLLLKQLAMAEDDIRGASSGFQMVSSATPPEHSERGVGRLVAATVPLVALLAAALVVLARELRGFRILCASEAAFFARAPVLWSTSWPATAESEESALVREIADVWEDHPGALGVATLGGAAEARRLGELLIERIQRRGGRGALLDAAAPRCSAGATTADVLEGASFGALVGGLTREHDHVVVLLPPGSDVAALRAAARWLDGLLVLVPSGAHAPGAVSELVAAASVRGRGVGLALVSVPESLLSSGHRGVGDPARLFREAAVPRRDPPVPPARVAAEVSAATRAPKRDDGARARPESGRRRHARAEQTRGAAAAAARGAAVRAMHRPSP